MPARVSGARSLSRLEHAMESRAGKIRNIFLVWLVWPLITLGIYFFIWYYKVNREVRDFDSRIEVSPAVSVIAVLFGWIIIVPPFVSIYRTGERIAKMQRAAGLQPTCSPIVGLLLTLVFGLDSLYYQNELNRIWAHYGNPLEGASVKLAARSADGTKSDSTASTQDDAEKRKALREERTNKILNRTGQIASIGASVIGAIASIRGMRKAKLSPCADDLIVVIARYL